MVNTSKQDEQLIEASLMLMTASLRAVLSPSLEKITGTTATSIAFFDQVEDDDDNQWVTGSLLDSDGDKFIFSIFNSERISFFRHDRLLKEIKALSGGNVSIVAVLTANLDSERSGTVFGRLSLENGESVEYRLLAGEQGSLEIQDGD